MLVFKRRLTAILSILIPFSLVCIGLVSVFWLIKGATFQVKTVYIVGQVDIFPHTRVFEKERNLLTMSTRRMSQAIMAEYPYVNEVLINKIFPDSLRVTISERVPVLAFEVSEGETLLIDKQGKVLPPNPRYPIIALPKLHCLLDQVQVGDIVSPKIVIGAQVIAYLKETLTSDSEYLLCESEDKFLIGIDNMEVIFSPQQQFSDIASSLQFLLKQFRIEGNYPKKVDLRFDKPVLVPEDVPSASVSATLLKAFRV